MEYLTNRPESTTFSHFIPMFFLLFLLLRSFGLHANIRGDLHYPKEVKTLTCVDRTPFNEKIWWIDTSKQNEQLICSQRVCVFSEFYEQAPIDCTLARQISRAEKTALKNVNRHAKCLSDGKVILCQSPDGTVTKFDAQKKEEGPRPDPRVRFVGQV